MNNAVYKNASIVTGISVLERFLGFLYRVVLSRYIGAEGLGIYQVAHSLFALLQTLASGGLPVCVSRSVAKTQGKNDRTVLSAGLFCTLVCALPLCLLFWVFGNEMPFLFSGGEGISVLNILLVGLSFSCCYSIVRGYFWGNKKFLSASALELTEEIAMVILGVFLLRGAPTPLVGAERAAWALCIADILSCLIAFSLFFSTGGRLASPQNQIKPLFTSAAPVTAVRAGSSLVNSSVSVLLPLMLVRAGATKAEALALFGTVSGMVLPVLFIPATLIGSLALVLIPELSADFHRKRFERLKSNILRGLRFSILVACALIPFFFVLGKEVGLLAFSNNEAGNLIQKGCLILLPMSLAMISSSILNSVGFEKQTFLFFLLGAAATFLCILILPPLCGIYAYLIGLSASYLVTAACNLLYLKKRLSAEGKDREQISVRRILTPLVGILPLSLFGQLCFSLCTRFLGGALPLLATATLLAIATLAFYLLTAQLPPPVLKRKRRSKNCFIL